MLLASLILAAQAAPAYADSIDTSFPALQAVAVVYCKGLSQPPCIGEQMEAGNMIKRYLSEGHWAEEAIRRLVQAHTRDDQTNWVAVKAQAIIEMGDPLYIAPSFVPRRERSITTTCRTYSGKRYASTTCTTN